MELIYDNQNPDIGKPISILSISCVATTKMSIAVYLRNYIRSLASKIALTPDYTQILLDIFYRALVSGEILLSIKRHLFLVFEHLITLYQSLKPGN